MVVFCCCFSLWWHVNGFRSSILFLQIGRCFYYESIKWRTSSKVALSIYVLFSILARRLFSPFTPRFVYAERWEVVLNNQTTHGDRRGVYFSIYYCDATQKAAETEFSFWQLWIVYFYVSNIVLFTENTTQAGSLGRFS